MPARPTKPAKATRPAKAATKAARPARKAAKPAKPTKATKPARRPAKPAKPAAGGKRRSANFYELRSGRTRITYTESNIAGQPVVTYRDGKRDLAFTGDEIQQDPQQIGLLLTVVLDVVFDGYTDLLTLLVPQVNLTNGDEKVTTKAIYTRIKDSIGGPGLVDGQVQSYDTQTLRGTASFIVS
jgi:hypothetical protein